MVRALQNNGKILGVIGGMGPLATHLYYRLLIEYTDAHSDQEHIDMILLNHASVPDRTKMIVEGKTEELLNILAKDAKMLEANGASVIAIPCNTSHVLINQLQEQVNIPIINMVKETVRTITEKFDTTDLKIAIWATDGTIQTGIYQDELKKAGITPVVPSEKMQALVMKIIYDGIKNCGEIDFADFQKIQEELVEADCQGVILACTELSCLKEVYDLPDYYIDTMEVLVKESIIACDKNVRDKEKYEYHISSFD
ncbi:MAG: aspartate/glutamate racemase family protein [Anaerovoracaceae bacterium]|jgi:aspartate racemase